jgi:hypothetical protein
LEAQANSNYDKHYTECRIQPIEVKEMLWSRGSVYIPSSTAGNIGDAIARLMRIGLKDGEPWEKEVEKAINELYRARYGVWLDGGIQAVYNAKEWADVEARR